ncbi:HlyD family secretion protein [Geminicoccus flavidas]|uniref:HlyD family secretion protein n=1 Tax=Geminicoccus flavidas TaxID=2506407 RepID=UPI00190F0B79|nr:HlyD family secretion protein [Geminicoccus flavidas]
MSETLSDRMETSAAQERPSEANPLRRVAFAVVALIAVLFTLSILMERSTPSSSQAVVQAYVVPMASEVGGRVAEISVIDNARVQAGQTLFRIDPQPYEIAVAEAEARLEQIGQTIGASTAAIEGAQAQVIEAEANRANVREQAQRVMQLVKRGVYARARYDEAKATLDAAEAAVTRAEANLERARQELGPAGENNPQLKQALAALEQAQLNLVRTTVTAPSDGVIANLKLAVGQVVGVGQPALTFIDAGTVWISASFKENSLEYMQPNDMASVVFDTLPGRVFSARVESVGWGVAQAADIGSSSLPIIRNDSGWVREPQRFPVRLVLLDDARPAGPRYGSQVDVVIYTGDNPVLNALGVFWIRVVSVLTYVS